MRPKLILLLVLAIGAIASSAYIVIKSGNEKNVSCQKKCIDKKPPVTESSEGGDEIFNASFNHLIVSTIP